MKTIEVDDELYQYIASNTQKIGESASEILRRLLGFAPLGTQAATAPQQTQAQATQPASQPAPAVKAAAPEANSAVGRFIGALTELYQRHGDAFSLVLNIRGRDRLYFATSAEALSQAGKSTNPKAIVGSPYWVVTNNNTEKKRNIVAQVMAELGYEEDAVQAFVEQI
ncbi:replication initiation regulator SeqA [Gallaecimonas kandeliae]|uniref:replication initiation regulator SeqA n=1 Tax=Gallaecimonas kandeliae TaxID=3029055 RepID=UPI0026480244|nr:replication initiation regulator SeqA [Gallaecimonas kandeliae]WKE67196.1 replication initiation regulator SeqA [Gallaecimonas kandeliae]